LKRKLKRVTIAFISALMIIAVVSIGFLILRPTQTDTNYQVIRIIDGDTVEIQYEGRPTSVQLIGVDAPETVRSGKPPERYGEEATRFLQDFLLDESVYFRFGENKWDKYDRILAYVYRASDGIFVNLEIIREGYGRVDTRYPFRHEDTFMSYESRARTVQKGLWNIR
jgi:micrococcal nuclease